VNIALGQWIAHLANQRAQQTGQDPVHELTWALEWVDTQAGAYRALGASYGDDDAGLLRWLEERNPLASATVTDRAETKVKPAPEAHA